MSLKTSCLESPGDVAVLVGNQGEGRLVNIVLSRKNPQTSGSKEKNT